MLTRPSTARKFIKNKCGVKSAIISINSYTMRKIVLVCIAFSIIAMSACEQKQIEVYKKYLNTNNLTTQIYRINTKTDTSINTTGGIILKIAANSIKSNTEIVTLEIKEALSLYNILQAGLTTQSDKGMLMSDGMFYISTRESSVIKIPIQVSVPTIYANDKMQVYKGKENNNKISWQEPVSIKKIITTVTDNGKLLYIKNCASCHAIDKELTAPALAWMDKKNIDKKTLYAFIRNSQEVLKTGNNYYNCLYCSYNKTPMMSFPLLSNDDIDAIIRYVNKEAVRLSISENFSLSYSNCDSCSYYYKYYASLLHTRDSLVINNGDMTKVDIIPPADADPNADKGTIPTKVNPPKYRAEYYQFNISGYGWYNIDDLVEGRFNAKESELTVTIEEPIKEKVNVFLIIPSFKVFNEGGLLNDDEDYGFYNNNGKIYLPQNEDAFVVGLSEQGGKLYFGQTHFTTSFSQNIRLTLYENTKDEILKSLAFLKLESANVKIETTKNFQPVTNIDSLIENIANKVSNCECYPTDTINTVTILKKYF